MTQQVWSYWPLLFIDLFGTHRIFFMSQRALTPLTTFLDTLTVIGPTNLSVWPLSVYRWCYAAPNLSGCLSCVVGGAEEVVSWWGEWEGIKSTPWTHYSHRTSAHHHHVDMGLLFWKLSLPLDMSSLCISPSLPFPPITLTPLITKMWQLTGCYLTSTTSLTVHFRVPGSS